MNESLATKITFALSLLIVATLVAFYVAPSPTLLWVALLAAAVSAGLNVRAVLPRKNREPSV